MNEQIKVLIIEDSAFMRRELTKIVNCNPEFLVIGAAMDAKDGITMAKRLKPDIITIDFKLPDMDGITCLQHIMIECPTPCIMISAYTKKDTIETFEALELGAVDFIQKPSGEISKNIWDISKEIHNKLKMASIANLNALNRFEPISVEEKSAAIKDTNIPTAIVVIGVSTGGPRVLMKIMPKIPKNIGVPILLIQHMPQKFIPGFVERINQYSSIEVKEAEQGELLLNNIVYVAKGGKNILLSKNNKITINVKIPSKNDLFVPSIDKGMNSAIDIFQDRCVGVILTGMCGDGSQAMERLYNLGGETIVESKETAVIFGMPQDVIKKNAAKIIAPAHEIANKIQGAVNNVYLRKFK